MDSLNAVLAVMQAMSMSSLEIAPGFTLAAYANTLYGPRKRGSTTEAGLEILPDDRKLVEFTPEEGIAKPGSRYYRVEIPELAGRLGAIPLKKALDWMAGFEPGVAYRVARHNGPHGPELRIGWATLNSLGFPNEGFWQCDTARPFVNHATIITEQFEGFGTVIATWHPGDPLATLNGDTDTPFDKLNPQTAVKLVW